MRQNQEFMVKNNSSKSKARVTSNIVKHIFKEKGIDRRGGTAQLETGSRALRVTLGSQSRVQPKPRRFDIASMLRLQTACNLSDKTVL